MSNLEDRMKDYEQHNNNNLIDGLPVCARLDGRNFSRLLRKLERPFSMQFHQLMVEVTKRLMEESGACFAHTHSDEISLIFWNPNGQIFFNGKVNKLNSCLAGLCSVMFNSLGKIILPELNWLKYPHFDCRVWNLPNKIEAANTILWRQIDGRRNSIQSAARRIFSHRQLTNASCDVMLGMMEDKQIYWTDYPSQFKYGTQISRVITSRQYTEDELSLLPTKHEAHKDPNLKVLRKDLLIGSKYMCDMGVSKQVNLIFGSINEQSNK